MIKRWYFILSSIWIAFWTLDIFFLIPQSPFEEIRLFFTDASAFKIYGLWIFAPVILYLLIIALSKLVQFSSRQIYPQDAH